MVLSMPRSSSTWVANWLTTEKTLCLHDPILRYAAEEFDSIPCDRTLGIACTGTALLADFVNAHPARKLILHRDRDEVNRSLETIGLSALQKPWTRALDRLRGMHVYYTDLFDPVTAAPIYEYVTGQPMDTARHLELVAMHIEPHFERIQLKLDRARSFRERIERAFA